MTTRTGPDGVEHAAASRTLLAPERPLVGTGLEAKQQDSGMVVVSRTDGGVVYRCDLDSGSLKDWGLLG